MNSNERAYDLLVWQTVLEPAPYDEMTDYHATWRERSDQALDDWDKDHPHESGKELSAFRELERMGHYSHTDYYSPTKAKDDYYTAQLAGLKNGSIEPSGRIRRAEASRKIRNQCLSTRGKAPKTPRGGAC